MRSQHYIIQKEIGSFDGREVPAQGSEFMQVIHNCTAKRPHGLVSPQIIY